MHHSGLNAITPKTMPLYKLGASRRGTPPGLLCHFPDTPSDLTKKYGDGRQNWDK